MPVIDFGTGEIEAKELDPERSNIINLDTGEITEIEAPTFEKAEIVEPPPPQQIEGQDVSNFRPAPDAPTDEGAFGRNVQQGMLNIGGGILRGFGELRKELGDEGAAKFLEDLEISQNMEQQKTDIISADDPIKSFAGEVVGETIGLPIGGIGTSLVPKLVSGAVASATSGGLSAAGRGESGTDVAIEAGISGILDPVIQGIGIGRKLLKKKGQASELGGVKPETEAINTAVDNVQEGVEAQLQTGIRTLPAQKTLDPFQLESQSFIGQNPEASTKAFNVLKTQNKEVASAVSDLLNMIAAPTSPSTAPSQAREVAANIVSAASLIRSEKASPIYKQAFRRQRQGKNALIDTAQIELKASKMADQFDDSGEVSKNLRTVLDKVSNAKGDLAKLHNAKLEIDQIIDGRGDNAIGNTTKRFLTDVQNDLVGAMTDQSPSYRAARDEFRNNSPLVDEVRAGVFGRIADVADKDLKRISGIIFDATESNPEISMNAIKALKNVEGGAEIASGLLRTEIEKRLGRMKSELSEISATGGRKVENVPANLLNTFFGNAKQKNMLMGALHELNPKAAENAKWLEKSLVRASSGRPGGSQTGIRNVINEQLRGITFGIRSFFKSPIDSLAGIGEEAQFSRKAAALGEALYNPTWLPDMAKIRKLNPNGVQAQTQFEALLNKIVKADEISGISRRSATVAPRVALDDENTDQQN